MMKTVFGLERTADLQLIMHWQGVIQPAKLIATKNAEVYGFERKDNLFLCNLSKL